MWNKNLIGLLCIISLYGCDQAVSEVDKPTEPKVALKDFADNPAGASSTGRLPDTPPPKNVANIQAKFQTLLDKGIPAEKFANFEIKPEQSVSSSVNGQRAMRHDNGNYKMFLVKFHLVEIAHSSCLSGNSFEGWIAAQKHLTFQVNEPAIQFMHTRPYRVRICSIDGVLKYEVVELEEALFP